LIAGLIGKVATAAKVAVSSLTGVVLSGEVPLSGVLPEALSIWIPEGTLGFSASLTLVLVGAVASRTGTKYERFIRG